MLLSGIRRTPSLLLPLLLWLAGCSGSTDPKDALAPLVGAWRADAMVLTNLANTSMEVDLVTEGAVFTISILGNGQYSASLSAFGQAHVEVGTVSVNGNQITIAPTSPPGPETTGEWSIQGGRLLVDGQTEYDFNQDGTAENATLHLELRRIDL